MVKLPYNTPYWTKEKCLGIVDKCNTRTEFSKLNGSAYRRALKMGWLDEFFEN